ncbi:YfhO family protein [Acetobacteraceae bacterium KSS8]|uniref:YfhO family protein n=1 Tax=Endosaccharibacter trunci TaxID=2812733 RepID=A0ABT1W311_9PROT|nr:YfhO family protein [Acetobacteraceae bacterium KSS8]
MTSVRHESTRRILAPELLLLLFLPFLIQLPALTGWLSADPIFREAAIPPGPVASLLRGDPGWVDGNSGATTQALGHLAAEQWLHGHVPWWNHFTALGMPLAAEMQNSALYLPFVLLLHFDNGVLLLKIAMQILSGVFMAALLREYGLRRVPVLAGAVMFEFGGTLAWFAHGPIMPVPFLPLLVLGIERTARARRSRHAGNWGWIAIAIAGSIYAGFPETAFMDGLVALVVAGLRIAQARRDGWRLALRIAIGGITGLLLSAPAWLPFAESLQVSLVGQNTDFAGTHLLRASYAMLLFPYLFGPIQYSTETLGILTDLWWHTGGYCDLLLAVAGGASLLCRGGRQRPLRMALGVWILLSLLKAAGVPGISQAFDLIPFIRQTMFYVYASPGWQFSLMLLAALFLDDLAQDIRPSRFIAPLLLLLSALAGGWALVVAWPSVHALLAGHAPNYRAYMAGALVWAVLSLVTFLACWRRPAAAAFVLAVDAVTLFALPVLSGTLHGTIDTRAVAFLRHDLGPTGRGYGLSRMAPNYGAFFGVPMLNYAYVPVPKALATRMRRDLDPDMDPTGLFGDRLGGFSAPVPDPLMPQLTAAAHIARLERLGVSDLLVPHGADPLRDEIAPSGAQQGTRVPKPIPDGTILSGTLALPTGDATLERLGLVLGTYGTRPSGTLALDVCVSGACRTLQADLDGAVDNNTLWFGPSLDLQVTANDRLTFTLRSHLRRGSLAVWEIPMQGGPAPFMVFGYRAAGAPLPVAFDDGSSAVLRLPHPSPYAETSGADCRIAVRGFDEMESDCAAPARLLRRELFYPGWTATVDGIPTTIIPADADTFQSIPLPAGHAAIRFRYAPPHIGLAVLASLAGLGLLGWNVRRRRVLR